MDRRQPSMVVVDDAREILELMQDLLEREGLRVRSFDRPREALEFVDRHPADILLTDLKMAGMDGLDLIERVRSKRPETIVVLMTGFGSEDILLKTLRLGAFDYLQKPFTKDQLMFCLRRAVEKWSLDRETLQARTLERELDVARSIQKRWMPGQTPALSGVEVEAFFEPSREVGGDFYDVSRVAPGKIGLLIGDVAGKGMPAALIMAEVRMAFRIESRRRRSPRELLLRVNRELKSADGRSHVTCFYGVYDQASGEMIYCNAGHDNPLLYRARDGGLDSLDRGGFFLGVYDCPDLEEGRAVLEPGDALLLYTDGLTDQYDANGEKFGLARLKARFMDAEKRGGRGLERVVRELSGFRGQASPFDDLAAVYLKVNGWVRPVERSIRSSVDEVGRRGIRAFLENAAEAVGTPPAMRHAYTSILVELAENAFEHAYPDGNPGPCSIVCRAFGDDYYGEVEDAGKGFNLDERTTDFDLVGDDRLFEGRGRGLALARALADDLESIALPGGGTRMVFRKTFIRENHPARRSAR